MYWYSVLYDQVTEVQYCSNSLNWSCVQPRPAPHYFAQLHQLEQHCQYFTVCLWKNTHVKRYYLMYTELFVRAGAAVTKNRRRHRASPAPSTVSYAAQDFTIQCHTIQHRTIPHHTMTWRATSQCSTDPFMPRRPRSAVLLRAFNIRRSIRTD